MRVVALISGGKDSCYSMMQCVAEGHEIVALANLRPKDKDELDSYMYQSVGHEAISLYADAMGLPLYRGVIDGESVNISADYWSTAGDEVEDLYQLLMDIKSRCQYDAVSVGAILSDYQRVRVENVCSRVGVNVLAYLWRRDQKDLLEEMIKCQVHAIIIKVAALGLEPKKHIGKSLEHMQPHLLEMADRYGLNMCGEGGEYETFTLDCPLFKKRIIVDESEMVMHSDDPYAPVAYLKLNKLHLEEKAPGLNVRELIASLPMKTTSNIIEELLSCHSDNVNERLEDVNITADVVVEQRQQQHEALLPMHESSNKTTATDWLIMKRWSFKRDLLYMTGVTGSCQSNLMDGERGMVVESAVRSALDTVRDSLYTEGLSMSDLIAVHLYVADMKDFSLINTAYKSYFSINPPIRLCCETSLPPDTILLLDCIARCHSAPQSSTDCRRAVRHTMHVQSISHWAPANIGPYSQAVQIGETVYVAGQIGLVPASMCLIDNISMVSLSNSSAMLQATLALRHCLRVIKAMDTSGTGLGEGLEAGLQTIVLSICYVTRHDWIKAVEGPLNNRSTTPPCLLLNLFVIVTGLPRGALVEWQVIGRLPDQSERGVDGVERHTSQSDGAGGRTVRCISTAGHQCRVNANYTCSRGMRSMSADDGDEREMYSQTLLNFVLTVDRCDHPIRNRNDEQAPLAGDDFEQIQEEMRTTLAAVLNILQRESLTHKHLTALRLFYRRDCYTALQLQTAYLSQYLAVLGCHGGDVTPIAMIPVEGFRSALTVLAICQAGILC